MHALAPLIRGIYLVLINIFSLVHSEWELEREMEEGAIYSIIHSK